ncbi:hypothetical protein OIU77_014252 [Salix suchowensis]|uniref:DUF7054 domain-containing protein n=1 Tax=Salix suchowensis TaxID=1278906 RepID=A0ABQ8ZWP1_9ROSI|nr:hypothetical protein OIU77_014252 [Salix suchowensis]
MVLYKQKRNQAAKGNRFLISVTVLGSAGPIRFVVNEEELVVAVIDTALKSYAREGRLPILGSDLNDFLLYCPNAGSDAISPWETIGSLGARNFMLCKKPQHLKVAGGVMGNLMQQLSRRGVGAGRHGLTSHSNIKVPFSLMDFPVEDMISSRQFIEVFSNFIQVLPSYSIWSSYWLVWLFHLPRHFPLGPFALIRGLREL